MRGIDFLTLDDVETAGKRILLRVDINSPINPETMEILDDWRIKAIIPTLKELEDSKVVILAHQGRPGEKDFTTLEPHAEILEKYLNRPVKFVDDVIGEAARHAIQELENGEILMLQNVRFCSEEVLEGPPEFLVRTHLVRRLAPLFDLFVNDAFAAAHRSQPSLVGFAEILPTVAGRVMERELKALQRLLEAAERPCVFVFGGAKIEDKIRVMKSAIENSRVDKIILGGLVANVFLIAAGYNIGEENKRAIRKFDQVVNMAMEIFSKYREFIELPDDVAVEVDGTRQEISITDLPAKGRIKDIGQNTIVKYAEILRSAKTIVANGPMGVFEEEQYSRGTNEILKAIANVNAFSVIGGGHLGALAVEMGIESKISHISTGGGAMMALLSGEKLPVIEALKRAAQRFKGK
ncbi:MAG: phosphoglycerate kinase [Candidatus Baldrarchaeia archaeon]